MTALEWLEWEMPPRPLPTLELILEVLKILRSRYK